MEAKRLRIAMFSTIVTGGAGYAALRVHDALRCLEGASSTLYVGRAEFRKHPGVKCVRDAEEGCQPLRVPGLTNFSVDPPGIPDQELERIIADSDIFSLHWFARFLSLRNIERLTCSGKPVVMTIRDMNPMTGGCHFFHGCENWKQDCMPCPQFNAADLSLPSATLDAKTALWDFDNITVIALSDLTAQLVKRSPLFHRCRVEKIPNPMDISIFKPHDRQRTRAEFRVPRGKRAIAYLPSFSSSVKGSAQAVEAFRLLANEMRAKDCVVLCAGELDETLDLPFETVNVGFIRNKWRLARFYSAADVTLIPSTEETFSNTAAESVACGTPVVGFQVGAIPEIAQGVRGRAVPLNDVDALADGVKAFALEQRASPSDLHRYVTTTFGADAIGRRYLKLFDDLCAGARSKAPSPLPVATAAPESKPVQHFDNLLTQYRERRSIEMEEEREATARERRTLRGMMTFLVRGVRLFFSDNPAFRNKTWNGITGRS